MMMMGGKGMAMQQMAMMEMMMGGKGKGKGKKSNQGLNDFPAEKKVWVGNLPESITFKELQAHFNQAGKTTWAECWKGTGGVAYKTSEEATAAISAMNGTELGGAIIQVDVWTQKEGSGQKRKHDSWDGGMSKMMKGGFGGMMPMMMPMMGMGGGWGGGNDKYISNYKVDETGGNLGEFKGTIKSFAEGTGYGFIECPEIKNQYGADVFLHQAMKKGYRVGMTVKFTCVLNKDGKPQAKDLKSGLKDGDGATTTAVSAPAATPLKSLLTASKPVKAGATIAKPLKVGRM